MAKRWDVVIVEHPSGYLFLPEDVADEFGLREDDFVEGETYKKACARAGEVLEERARDWERRN